MKHRDFSKRVCILAAAVMVWGLVIGVRLSLLQVVQSAELRARAEKQQKRSIPISPKRGAIYDRNGNELAISITVESVFAVPEEVRDVRAAARTLSAATGVPRAELENRLSSDAPFVWIKRKVSDREAAAVRKLKTSGVYFQKENKRFYPKGAMAAHTLGHVNLDEVGIGGLEYRYNSLVRGKPGQFVFMSDARGRSFQTVEQAPSTGADLVTTIDENIQYILEKELTSAAQETRSAGISLIAMDPRNGEILGMASAPQFDPNSFSRYPQTSWRNLAVNQVYEPGSTFKIVTAMAALEEGLTKPEEVIDCQMGAINVFGLRIRDHKPFGLLTVKQVMQYSSDVGIIKLGMRLGNDRFADYIDRMGFGRPTEVDLPGEEVGLFKPAARWSKVSVGAISMGQEIGVTPLQILRMVSAVANGGILYRPYVVQRVEHPQEGILEETSPAGVRVMSPETALKLQDMLEVVVTEGTAKSSRLDGYRAAGKTGTAQKIDPATRAYSKTKHVASFAGYAPASNPAVAVIVVLDEPEGRYHGGDVAAPIFKRIVEQVLRYKAVPADAPDYAPHYVMEGDTPVVQTRADASAPRAVELQQPWQVVDASVQTDSANDAVDPYAASVTVPDFRGLPLRRVTEDCLKLGLKLRSTGSGAAGEQLPAPGTVIPVGARVLVRFTTRQ